MISMNGRVISFILALQKTVYISESEDRLFEEGLKLIVRYVQKGLGKS